MACRRGGQAARGQAFGGERLLFSFRQRHGRFDFGDIPNFIVAMSVKRFAFDTMHLDFDGPLKFRRFALEL